jgi:hypothetical protein
VIAARANALPPDSPLHPDNLGRLSNLVSANPGISPDAAVTALTAGLPADSPVVKGLQEQFAAQKAQQAQQAQAAADKQAAQNDDNFFKATVRTALNVMDAPFQVIMNKINNDQAQVLRPGGPQATAGDILFNTDAAHQIESWFDPSKAAQGDFGTGWIPDANSTGIQYKYNEDVRLSNNGSPTAGGKLADALELQQGSHPYSIVSGLVDLGTRVLDPTMYVGGGEVSGLVRGGSKAVDAAARAASIGKIAGEASKGVQDATDLIGRSFDTLKQVNEEGVRLSQIEQDLKVAQNQQAVMHAEAPVLRQEAATADQQADTLVARYVDSAARQNIEEHRQSLLDIDAMAKQSSHETAASITGAVNEAEYMGAQKAEMLGNGHDLPKAGEGPKTEMPTDKDINLKAKQHLATDLDAFEWRYGLADYKIDAYMNSTFQRNVWRSKGLVPLTVVKELFDKLGTESANALLKDGFAEGQNTASVFARGDHYVDAQQNALDNVGGSEPFENWMRRAFKHGKTRVVELPWKLHKAKQDELLHTYTSQIMQEEADKVAAEHASMGSGPAYDEGPTLFHGTSGEFIDGLKGPDELGGSGLLRGQGFYTTDNFNIARSYEKKGARAGKEPSVYDVKWTGDKPPVVLDADVESVPAAVEWAKNFAPYIKDHGGDLSALEDLLKVDPQPTVSRVIDAVRSGLKTMQRDGLTGPLRGDVDEYFQVLNQDLRDAGYDILRHEGGAATNSEVRHNVNVFLDTEHVSVSPNRMNKAKVNVAAATDTSRESIDAVRTGVLSSAEKLGEEFNLPEETVANLMGVDGQTVGEVIDNVKNVLTEAGTSQIEVEKFLYTLNDELMQHGSVVDGHPDLAPAGRGRDVAATHQAEQDAHDAILHLSDAHAQNISELAGLSEEVKQYIKDLNEAPINQLNREAISKGAKADRLDKNKAVQDMRRTESLKRLLANRQAQFDELSRSADQDISSAHAIITKVLESAGKEHDGDLATGMQVMRDIAGLRTTVNGVDSLVLDKGVKYLLGTKAEPLYRALVAIDDPVAIRDLTRGKLSVDMCKDLAAAKTVDEARAVIVRNMGTGMINKTTGQLMALRMASRSALGGRDPEMLVGPYRQAFGTPGKVVRYGSQVGKRNVPWSHARDVTDHEGMVDLVSDTANYMDRLWRNTSEDAGAFHDEWVGKMMDATTPEARRTVWYRMLDETVARAGHAQKLSEEDIADLQNALKVSRAKQQQLTTYLAEVRSSLPAGEDVIFQGQKITGDIAMLESEMSNRVMSPDWRDMRRALKDANSLKRAAEGNPEKRASLLAASDKVFDDFWRTSVLAFRGGYVVRNTADIAVRQLLAGQPGLFTSPWGIAAMVFGHKLEPNNALGKLLNRAERADLDVTGVKYQKVSDEDALMTQSLDGFNRVTSRDTSLLDPGAPSRKQRIGIQDVDATSPHFHKGWANEIGMMHASPMANEVFKVLIGKPSTPVKQWIKQTKNFNQRDALTDYFWNGPGRTGLDRVFDSSSNMRDKIKSPEDLKAYLFGEDAISLEQRWKRITLDLNPTIVDHISSGGFRDAMPEGASGLEPKDFTARRKASENLLKQVAPSKATQAADFPVKKVRAPIWINKGEQNHFTVMMQSWTDAFFHGASQIEKHAGYLPEFKYAKWENAADLASALSPEDAAKLLDTAKETLSGGNYYSWASKTLRRLEDNASRANGEMDLDTLKRITDQHAVNVVKDMFYDAQKRNAFGHATRLISPFAQAWANSLKTWGLLAAKNPEQIYRAETLYEAGSGKDSTWFEDAPSNPDNALFYTDPQTGQAMIGIPLAGRLLALAGSLPSAARGGGAIDPSMVGVASPVSSFNLLFQNGMLPGVGPAISLPASSLDSTQAYNAMVPDWLKKVLVPYTNVNPDTQPGILEAQTPAWLGNILGGLGVAGYSERVTKYVKPAMGTLFSQNPSRYLNQQGLMDDAGQRRLLNDSNALAYGILFGKGILQNSSAGSVMPQLYAQDRNGNNLSQLVLAKEYQNLTNPDIGKMTREDALASMADKYGVDVMMTMLPTREFGYQPTDAAYQFVKQNPEVATDALNVLPLFLPGGGYSAYMARLQNDQFGNKALTDKEMIARSNDLLHAAQVGQLDRKLVAGDLNTDEYKAQLAVLNKAYKVVGQAPNSNNNNDHTINELRLALRHPELANTEAGRGIDVYLQLRDNALAASSGNSIGGAGDAPLRAWLRQQGEELGQSYPEFKTAWAQVFESEVKN